MRALTDERLFKIAHQASPQWAESSPLTVGTLS
jgi:hypothetical protein